MTIQKCGSKVKHPTAGAARRVMRKLQDRGKVLGECNVYPCKVCGGWHWGRSKGSKYDRAAQTIAAIDRALERDKMRSTP